MEGNLSNITVRKMAVDLAMQYAREARDFPGLSALQGHSRQPMMAVDSVIAMAEKFETYLTKPAKRKRA